jgi:tetratricopeptide (TPR) repeat protein
VKRGLRALIEAGRAKEESDLVPSVDDNPAEKPGAWTAKDQLAHLAAWREVAAADLDAARTGRAAPDVSDDDDLENAKVYDRTHQLPAATVRKAASDSWDQLAAALQLCSAEDLTKRRERGQEMLWQVVQNNACFHTAEHLVYFHTEQGDEAAAEAAAKWSHDVAIAKLHDDRARGTAAYNLGCFYARRGRATEAMPFLRTGIELRPDLRDWAKQDADLDPIRTTAELMSLLH